MTSTPTITERVAEMQAVMAAAPRNEAMGAFAREQVIGALDRLGL